MQEGLLTSSLLWQVSVPLGEAANYIEQESVRSELKTAHSYAKFDNNTMVSVFGRGQWRTCATRDDEPRPLWTSLPITHQ